MVNNVQKRHFKSDIQNVHSILSLKKKSESDVQNYLKNDVKNDVYKLFLKLTSKSSSKIDLQKWHPDGKFKSNVEHLRPKVMSKIYVKNLQTKLHWKGHYKVKPKYTSQCAVCDISPQ